ncbi:hypothetical protein ACFS4T_29180 [Pseudomonas lini]
MRSTPYALRRATSWAPTWKNLELTGTVNTYGIGNASNNAITGNDGNNQLNGAAGVDTLIGGKGNDDYFS